MAGFSIESILAGVLALEPLVAATEVGLICPNTSESERLRELELVGELVAELGRQCRSPCSSSCRRITWRTTARA